MHLSTWTNDVAKPRRQRRTPFLRVPVTAVVLLGLQLTALVSISASPAAAAEKKPSKVAKDLPGLSSPAPPKANPEIPDGSIKGTEDIAARPSDLAPRPASEKPPSFDPVRSRPIEAETTATRRVYLNEDKTTTVQLSPRPTRVKDAATGKWKDIDLALVAGSDGTLAPKVADSGVSLAPKADGTSINLDTQAGKISVSRPGAGPAPAVLDGSKATYKGALGGRDLVVAATADGFAESVVLHDAKAGASYVNEFTLPVGMTAREGSGGVEFVNAKGEIVATFVAGLAFDSAREPDRDSLAPVTVSIAISSPSPAPAPAPSSAATSVPGTASPEVPASTTSTSTTAAAATAPANVVKVEVSIPKEWLAAPERTFPVTIDPFYARYFYSPSTQSPGADTFVLSGPYANTSYGTDPNLWGGNVLGAAVARTLIRFDLGAVAGPNVVVSNASMSINNSASYDCNARWTTLYGLGGAFSSGTTWNTQPPLDGAGPVTYKAYSHGAPGCYPSGEVYDVTSIAKRWLEQGAPNYGVMLTAFDENDVYAYKQFVSGRQGSLSAPTLSVTYDRYADQAMPVAPANGAVINTLTPTLIVQPGTDPDAGDIVQFWHRLTTTPDAESGAHLVDSGWRYPGSIPNPNTHFKVPEGVLADGVTYYWHVWSYDGTLLRAPDWVWSFRVALGVGERSSQPHDQLGPARVNLASGNLMVGASSPSFPTVGGDVGLSYAYNSAQPMARAGLTGAYYDKPLATADPATHTIGAGDTPAMVRTDPVVSHWWSGGSPGAGLSGTNFTVRWTGYVSVPNAGSYTFGAQSDDGMRITLGGTFVNGVISGGTTVIDRWSEQTNPGGWPNPWGTAYNFPVANSPVPIQIDYYQRTGNSYITLLAQGPLIAGYVFVPSSWLSIEPPALPAGWSVSASLDSGLAYSSARVWDAGVTLVDPMGGTHLYAATPGGGYSPPPEEDGVLTRDVSGRLTLHAADGLTYVFNANGTLASASSASDDRNPAAPIYTWGSIPGSPMISRLVTIADPVGGRQITLRYGGDSACPSPTPSGFGAVPRGMLCAVSYWDGTQTKVWYNANGQLARFEDPGRAVAGAVDSPPITDFVYGANGKLAQVRSPLVADAVAAGVVGYDDAAGTARTVIAYDASGRVASVTLPTPSQGAARPSHSFQYVSATETRVHVAGQDESITGFARKVTMDTAGRALADTDATNKTASATWDAGDNLTSSTDTAGRKTTTLYDVQGRPTDIYGPAPSSCFGADRRPNGSCAAIPHTATVYDGGMRGLAGTYWNNASMTGAPKLHRSGSGDPAGVLVAGSPDPVVGASWSARFTGEITLAAASNLQLTGSGTMTLLIDDRKVLPTDSVAAGLHRIQVEFVPGASPSLTLQRRNAGSGTFTAVAGTILGPRYGLPTRVTTDDSPAGSPSQIVATAYGTAGGWPDPAAGLATAVTIDPDGAALTTATGYEAAGAGLFLRRLSRSLPAGNATTYTYYGLTEARANPCPSGGSANQGGRLKLTAAPSPDGGATPAWTTENVYDAAGRVVATRLNTDPWTCFVYDFRGRVTSQAVPALGAPFNTPARTATSTYATLLNDPRTSTVADSAGTITTTVDLLGRVVSYADAWSNSTPSTYDQVGRLTDAAGRDGVRHTDYDPAGRPKVQKLDGVVVATATYDGAGELASVAYGNGTALSAIARDPAGRTTGLTWLQAPPAGGGAAAVLTSDSVTRSQSGRVVAQTVDADPATAATFTYDAPGRLRTATLPGHALVYSFDPTGGCGLAAGAGKNTNRTAVSDNGVATTYCYNRADQLTSSSDTSVGSPTYDPHGNTKTMGPQALTYDGSDRHVATTTGSTTVSYARDATGRIISRTEGGATIRYGYTGAGDSSAFTTDALGLGVQDRTIGLVGGVLLTKRSTGDVWNYPNIHGDLVATADPAGAKRGGTIAYDPFGKSLTPSGPTNPDGLPDNSAGNLDYGWLGQHQRGLEHAGGLATIEMGARPYVPATGRFLQVDPVEGGAANDYEYGTGDPRNLCDTSGSFVVAIPVAIGVGVGLTYLAGRLAGEPKFPSKNDCKQAKKLLTEYERLFEKVARKPLDQKRKENLDRKRDAGTIRKSDLPGQIQREFPGTLDGLTLSQIADICKYLYKRF